MDEVVCNRWWRCAGNAGRDRSGSVEFDPDRITTGTCGVAFGRVKFYGDIPVVFICDELPHAPTMP